MEAAGKEDGMTLSEQFVAEFDEEMKPTRRLLERVPSERGAWKPHQKSFALGHLAQLVARMPGWITATLAAPVLDLTTFKGYSFEKTETLLEEFDRGVKEARAALARATDADFAQPWELTMGGRALMKLPRRVAIRQHINHLCHHRGQLTVYLRLIDVPVPSIYGPTADERM